jgi:hypothetical protein
MAVQITGAAVANLSKKLENFASTLSDEERTLFKGILEGHGLSDEALEKATGGQTLSFSQGYFSQLAPALNAGFFRGLMCW